MIQKFILKECKINLEDKQNYKKVEIKKAII